TAAGPCGRPASARPTAWRGTPWGPGRPRGRTQPRGPPDPPSSFSGSSLLSPREERDSPATRQERVARAHTGHLLPGNGGWYGHETPATGSPAATASGRPGRSPRPAPVGRP